MASESEGQLAARQRAEEITATRDALVKEIQINARRYEAAKTARLRELRRMKEAAERAGAEPLRTRKTTD